ncbi:MAG: SDR family NAD(P)-dependent oxidoreductase [Candidatus Sumerlaeia bacterium]|nr:SDR family NAD(P)-dependent oxidoreductase [Candidatus Sumerlaeia bacterium]
MSAQLSGKTALVTGASSGIGAAIARALARDGARVALLARRGDRLRELAEELRAAHGTEALAIEGDVADRAGIVAALEALPEPWGAPDILVNNAGGALGLDKFQDGSLDDWDAMIDVNVKGLLYVTRTLVGAMLRRGSGHIVNIGSVAGHDVYPRGNVYCAAKFAVDAITRSLAVDLVDTPLRATSIDPGLVGGTEFSLVRFHGDGEAAKKPYQGIEPLTPEDVAECVLFAVTRPPHVQINTMILTATNQATGWLIHRKA